MSIERLFREGKEHFFEGHPEESIVLFTKAAEGGCNPVEVYLNRGAAYLTTAHYREAEGDFSLVLGIDTHSRREGRLCLPKMRQERVCLDEN